MLHGYGVVTWQGWSVSNLFSKSSLYTNTQTNQTVCVAICCRSAEIWAIFDDVFGGSARLQKILSTWGFVCSGSWGTGCGIVALNSSLSYGGVAAAADAVAVAGYFDCGLGQSPTLEAQVGVTNICSVACLKA
jgi:hypothetical protein